MINGNLRIPCVFRISVDGDWGPMTYGAIFTIVQPPFKVGCQSCGNQSCDFSLGAVGFNTNPFSIDNEQYVVDLPDRLIEATYCVLIAGHHHIASTCVSNGVISQFIITMRIICHFYAVIVEEYTCSCCEGNAMLFDVDLILLLIIFKHHAAERKDHISVDLIFTHVFNFL